MSSDPVTIHDPADVEAAALEAARRARRIDRQRRRDRREEPIGMTRLELVVAVLLGALLAAAIYMAARPVDASAAVAGDVVDVGDFTERAAGYHGEHVAAGVDLRVIYDPAGIAHVAEGLGVAPIAYVEKWPGEERARGPIHVGDVYLAGGPDFRCEVITHEYGHLLGLDDDVRYDRDPLFVMGADVRTPQCAELEPAIAAAAASTVLPDVAAVRMAANTTSSAIADELRTRRYVARSVRHECMGYAGEKVTRRQRVKARARCRSAYARATR